MAVKLTGFYHKVKWQEFKREPPQAESLRDHVGVGMFAITVPSPHVVVAESSVTE